MNTFPPTKMKVVDFALKCAAGIYVAFAVLLAVLCDALSGFDMKRDDREK